MSLRTPLSRVLGLGSARDGTDHWWAQRVSAVALALLGTWFAGALTGFESFSYAPVVTFVADPLNTVLLVLFCLALAYHSHLGVQVVIEDYVHRSGAKIVALILSRFVHIFVGVLSVYSVLRIGLGA